MLLEGMFVLLPAYAWALARFFTENEIRQTLLERGVAQTSANRAARYGRVGVNPHATHSVTAISDDQPAHHLPEETRTDAGVESPRG